MFDFDAIEASEELVESELGRLAADEIGSLTPFPRGSVPPELDSLTVLGALPPSKQWLVRYTHAPAARCRLVCIFGAGGSAAPFADWYDAVSESHPALELLLLELPGHGQHLPAAPSDDAAQVAEAASGELQRLLAGERPAPLAIFGFSIGAVVAHALARNLLAKGYGVAQLYACGRGGPGVAYRPADMDLQAAPADFLQWVRTRILGGVAAERLGRLLALAGQGKDSDALRRVAGLFREDLALGNSFAGRLPGASEAVGCNVHILASAGDALWPSSGAGAGCHEPAYDGIAATWAAWTAGAVTETILGDVAHHDLCALPVLQRACDHLQLALAYGRVLG